MKIIHILAYGILFTGILVIFLPEIVSLISSGSLIGGATTQLGDAFAVAGNEDLACICYDTSLGATPGNSEILMKKGDVLYKSGKPLEALSTYTQGIDRNPDNVVAMKKKADLLKSLGRGTEATDAFSKITTMVPKNSDEQMIVASAGIESGKYNTALDQIDIMLKANPKNPDLWEMRGDALLDYSQTDTTLKQNLREVTGGTEGHMKDPAVKEILAKSSTITEGVQSYRNAMMLDPMRTPTISTKIFEKTKGLGVIADSQDVMSELEQ
ncbi:MAG TPA: tetratricopeptide repeat protein [Methanospirillum sp.]|nr:tetratricopeptide repeat protein [Methanospirillum sp.]